MTTDRLAALLHTLRHEEDEPPCRWCVLMARQLAAAGVTVAPQPAGPIGWWSVSGDDLEKFTPAAARAMQDALRRASEGRKTIVTIDGITLRWHDAQPAPDALRAGWHAFANVDPDAQCPTCGFAAWMHDPAQVYLHSLTIGDSAADSATHQPAGLDVERLAAALRYADEGRWDATEPDRTWAAAIAAAYGPAQPECPVHGDICSPSCTGRVPRVADECVGCLAESDEPHRNGCAYGPAPDTLRAAAQAVADSAVLVPMEREDDDDGLAEMFAVNPDALAALRAALGDES